LRSGSASIAAGGTAAGSEPRREVADLDFRRRSWNEHGLDRVRVIAVQSRDRQGKQLAIFGDDLNTAALPDQPLDEDADDIA